MDGVGIKSVLVLVPLQPSLEQPSLPVQRAVPTRHIEPPSTVLWWNIKL